MAYVNGKKVLSSTCIIPKAYSDAMKKVGYEDALARRVSVTIRENGEYPPIGNSTGFKKVIVEVPDKEPNLQDKIVTANGEVVADEGYDGLGKVMVVVPQSDYFGDGKTKLAQMLDGTLTELAFGDLQGATAIGDNAFEKCKSLALVAIPASVESIGQYAFAGDSDNFNTALQRVLFEEGSQLTSIGENAFAFCTSLETIVFPNTLKSIGKKAFFLCEGFTDVIIPASVETIEQYAFAGDTRTVNGPKSVKFAEGSKLTKINTYTFQSLDVEYVELPENLTNIYNYAFSYCEFLKTIKLRAVKPPTLSSSAFSSYGYELPTDCKIVVPVGCGAAYKSATNWSKYASQIVEEGNSPVAGGWLFENEEITDTARTDLPAPVAGVSYTLFMDGVEIATATADEYGDLNLCTDDYSVWLLYSDGTGELGWFFHPVDSMVTSGSVSIRVNG